MVAKRLIKEVGLTFSKKSFSNASMLWPSLAASSLTKVSTPRELVGPGNTELTVILVPATCSANPRAIAIWAALVMP